MESRNLGTLGHAPTFLLHALTDQYSQIIIQIPWSKLWTQNLSSEFPISLHCTCVSLLNIHTCVFANLLSLYFENVVLIRGSVHNSVLLCVHQKREAVCALPFPVTGQGSTPSHKFHSCFTAYTFCDVTPQLFSLKGGGASGPKNPDLYYCSIEWKSNFNLKSIKIHDEESILKLYEGKCSCK